ncbi:MAG TPA: MauE/DoxX family redox-associated membrane protein [Actinopolymorphaceae bacterium]
MVLLTLLVALGDRLLSVRRRAQDRQVARLSDALRAHGIVPTRAVSVVAGSVLTVEAAIVATGVVGAVDGRPRLLSGALLGATVLFTFYAAYGAYVVGSGRTGPCGCSAHADVPMSAWVVGRSLLLAVMALVGLLGVPLRPLTGAELGLVLIAAATFTTLSWQLPAAMQPPNRGGSPSWTS